MILKRLIQWYIVKIIDGLKKYLCDGPRIDFKIFVRYFFPRMGWSMIIMLFECILASFYSYWNENFVWKLVCFYWLSYYRLFENLILCAWTISSTQDASSREVKSPNWLYCFSTIFRKTRRSILPVLVFGKRFTTFEKKKFVWKTL